MKDTFLFKEKRTYFQIWENNQYCVGDKTLSGSLLKAKKIAWPGKPRTADYPKVVYLRFKPTKIQAKNDGFPDYLTELPNIKQLDIPVTLLEKMDAPKNIPRHLETLIITANYSNIAKNERYPEFPTSGLEHLKGLVMDTDPTLHLTFEDHALSADAFPKLNYLNIGIDKEGKLLKCIKKFKALDFIEINNIANHPLFDHLPTQFRYLDISEMGKEFSFEKITSFKNVEYLNISHSGAEIDCSVFTHLPNLKEIILYSSKKITNASALLECKKLNSLTVMDCNNPFKKIDKNKFKEKFDQILDIELA